MAKEIGMSKAGLYLALEKERLSVDTLEKIAEALEVQVSIFFGDDSQKRDNTALIAEVDQLKKEVSDLTITNEELRDTLRSKRTIIKVVYRSLLKMKIMYTAYFIKIKLDKNPAEALKETTDNILKTFNDIIEVIQESENIVSNEENAELASKVKDETENR